MYCLAIKVEEMFKYYQYTVYITVVKNKSSSISFRIKQRFFVTRSESGRQTNKKVEKYSDPKRNDKSNK